MDSLVIQGAVERQQQTERRVPCLKAAKFKREQQQQQHAGPLHDGVMAEGQDGTWGGRVSGQGWDTRDRLQLGCLGLNLDRLCPCY